MNDDTTLSMVVLPVPVPPVTSTLSLPLTHVRGLGIISRAMKSATATGSSHLRAATTARALGITVLTCRRLGHSLLDPSSRRWTPIRASTAGRMAGWL